MELLHHQLGHISKQCIHTSTGTAKIITHRDSIKQCKVCICVKQTQAPISAGPTQHTKTVMELVHSNLCRPLAEMPGGHHYFVSFINDYMRYTQVYLIRAKTGLMSAFNNYLQATPSEHKCQSNQGGKYMGHKFQDLLHTNSVTHVPISSHTPKLNRVTKWFNHTALTMVQAYLAKASVKEELWG